MTDDFLLKHGTPFQGYSMDEALIKKAQLDVLNGVGEPGCHCPPAMIIPDVSRSGYYCVIILNDL